MDENELALAQRLNLEALRTQLDTSIFGHKHLLRYVPSIDSTNTYAMQLAREGSEEGMVVLTDSQYAGKGRLGRHWLDLAGRNVLSSTIVYPRFPSHLLVMLASLAVVDAISATTAVQATIKWPNDVLIGTRKVAGILIETSYVLSGSLVAVLGIGVNINGHIDDIFEKGATATQTAIGPGDLASKATTLETEVGHAVSRETFIAHLLHYIESRYLMLQQEAQESVASSSYRSASRLVREQWRDLLSTLGHTVEVRQGSTILSGVAENVNDQGELFLRDHLGKLVRITWGDVGHPSA